MNPMTQKTPPRSVNLPPQPPSIGYSPAVPISVYREVVAELQAAKTAMESIKTQNQQLTKQNQQLRQEIEKAVQSALQLRQVANAMSSMGNSPAASPISPHLDLTLDSELDTFQIPVMPPRMPAAPKADPLPPHLHLEIPEEKLVIEQDSKPRRKIKLEKDSSINLSGWMLGVVIALIVVSAFGAGFLLVRPLLTPATK